MHSARLLTNMKIKLSRKARHESQSSNEMKEKQKRGKNWIVNRRQRHNRMIGANNNTCTHASPSPQLLRFFTPFFVFNSLYWVLSDARVWLWFTFYNWNHWYRDLCWLRNASMEFSYNFKQFRPNASQQTPFFAHRFGGFKLICYTYFALYDIFLLPSICVRSMCTLI